MPMSSKYLLIASMDVDASKEALFNEVYDSEHVPSLGAVPGVLSVARFRKQPLVMSIGGERRTIEIENEPQYTTVYELESPEVLTSESWEKAIESGRWSNQVRPYTMNRRHLLLNRIYPS